MIRLAALLALIATPAYADWVEPQNLTLNNHIARVTLKIDNANRPAIHTMHLKCAFLDAEGRAIKVSSGWFNNIQPDEVAYTEVVALAPGVSTVQCRIEDAVGFRD